MATTNDNVISDEYAAIMEIDKNTAYLIQQVSLLSDNQVLTNNLLMVTIKGGRIEEIGGYVHGRTSTGDPFIILYPAKDVLIHKICRVYKERFHLLPSFIIPATPDNAPENNPDKNAARRQGIYFECQPFTIATEQGKETNMGNEIRFLMTVDATGTGHKFIQETILAQKEVSQAHNPSIPSEEAMKEHAHALGADYEETPSQEANSPISQEATNMNVDDLNAMLGLGPGPDTTPDFSPEKPDAPKTPENLTRRELPFVPDEPKPKDDVLQEPYKYGDGTLLSTKSATLTITYKAHFDVFHKIPISGVELKKWYDANRNFLNVTYDLPLPE